VSTERPMLVINPGPHIVENLQKRVASLTEALDRAQARIDELERVFGSEDDLTPIAMLGFSPAESRIIHVLRNRDYATRQQIRHAIYADNPDVGLDVDPKTLDTQICVTRKKLARLGLAIELVRHSAGYRMSGPNKARLAKLLASGARLVVRGRPDRKYYKQATARGESRAMNG
jgi:hypothetical protein